jgi:hypothetical protein
MGFHQHFPFKDPGHAKWLEAAKASALSLIVEAWGDEALLADRARQAAVERMVGLIQQVASSAIQVIGAGLGGGTGIHIAPGGLTIQNTPQPQPLVGVPCEFGGRAFFLAWEGDFDRLDIKDPREVMGEELVAIHCAICRYASDPQQPIWQRVQGPPRRDVWEVDDERTFRRKLKSAHLKHEVSFLTVGPRRDPACGEFCVRCGRRPAATSARHVEPSSACRSHFAVALDSR